MDTVVLDPALKERAAALLNDPRPGGDQPLPKFPRADLDRLLGDVATTAEMTADWGEFIVAVGVWDRRLRAYNSFHSRASKANKPRAEKPTAEKPSAETPAAETPEPSAEAPVGENPEPSVEAAAVEQPEPSVEKPGSTAKKPRSAPAGGAGPGASLDVSALPLSPPMPACPVVS